MGNTPSHEALTHFNEPFNLEEYTKIQQCYVEALGEMHELTNPLNKSTVFLKIIKIEHEVSGREIEILHQKFSVLHPNLLKTHGSVFSYKTSKGEVSTDAMIYFETPVKSLHDEIFLRKQTHDRFPAMELLVYLKNCIEAFALLEEKGCIYGQITPRTIFFSQNNQIKTVHPTLLGLVDFAESLRLETNKEVRRVMCLDMTKHLGFTRRSLKSSVFTLGVTFLASALLEEENMLYQSPNDPQTEKFRVYNQRLRSTYPSDFVNILRHMLEDDEVKRPSFIQLRDNLVEYMKSDTLDTQQFPMSPTYPTGKKKRIPFSESFPSKISKLSFSNTNTLGSPQNEITNSNPIPEWSFKSNPNSKSFLDRLFCGFCSTNIEEEIEIKQPMMSRPTRKQTAPEVQGNVDRVRESLQFNTELFDGLVKETSQQNQKTIPTVLTTDPHERYDENDSMQNVRLTAHNNDSIQIIEYHSQSQGTISKGHLPEKLLERQSISSPEKNESPKKVGMLNMRNIENIQSADRGMKVKAQTTRRTNKNSSTQAGTYQDINTYGSMTTQRQKNVIQTLTNKKKSKLVQQIISDYKKGGGSQTKSKANTARMPLEEIKTNDFSRFLESHDKHRPGFINNKSSYDELFGSNEKSKMNTLIYSEMRDMSRKNNEDGEGIFIEPEDSVYGLNVDSRLSRTRNRKSVGISNSPYRDGEGSYRSGDLVVTKNECPACNTQFMSVNRSFTYSLSTERVNRDEKEDTLRSLSHRKGSIKWNLANEIGSIDKNYSSPDNLRGQERHRDGCGYNVMVTPARQEPIRAFGLSSI